MYSWLLIILVPIFVIISCSEDITPTDDTNDYFPLLEKYDGLYWKYKTSMSDSILIVECKFNKEIDDNKYAVFISTWLPSNKVDTAYYRKDAIGNVYTYKNNKDELYIDFSGNKPDSTNQFLYFIANKFDSMSVAAGKFYDIAFVTNYAAASDGGNFDYYAKKVGLIQRDWFIGEIELVEYSSFIYE